MKLKYTSPKFKLSKIEDTFFITSSDILNSLDELIFMPVFASDIYNPGGEASSSGGGCGNAGVGDVGGVGASDASSGGEASGGSSSGEASGGSSSGDTGSGGEASGSSGSEAEGW